MTRKVTVLQRINNEHKITSDTDDAFVFQLQYALLLALRERGRLNATQYRYAAEKLRLQHQEAVRKMTLDRGSV